MPRIVKETEMSYMESQMQFQIEASIELEKAICDDACDIFKETGIMPLDMKMQRDELQSQLALMKDRIDSLEKDAARYQWLRDKSGAESAIENYWGGDGTFVVYLNDESIDAAMAINKKETP